MTTTGQLADATSMPLDGFEVSGEVATARSRVTIDAGVIEAGTVAVVCAAAVGIRTTVDLPQVIADLGSGHV